ncbi:MFS transporter [Aliiroseovarius sp. M344]|uniref:MFS transporter n=1 Tax=Aliiroseovarius sp. M344 TaxID=2867010 RepID=UPI0021ADA9C6|nr:MFS transporter [Aliiroseovarius sp. M344]UWQ15906.1 MFS transporter [Aliiroseovarius sp. M344]
MRFLISFAPLLLSVVLLQLSSGGVGPLDAVSGLGLGFTKAEIGMLGSAHFVGFFVGCWWAPRLMGSVGHARAFAGFTAMGAIGLLAHMLWVAPVPWAVMRIATGLSVAGAYTVIEAWLNASITNETRGRAMGGYRLVDLGGSLAAQLLIGVLEPAHYASYNVLALACCAAILPLALTRTPQPETPDTPRLRPMLAWTCSPLAVAGVVVAGITSAAFRMVGPIYGQEVGLATGQLAWFLASFVLGGAVAQLPVGWLADRYDRRGVLIGLSVAAILSCGVTVLASGMGQSAAFVTAGLFGFTTFPIFSVSAAHANDFATSEQRVELSAALMFFYAVGAIASPLVASGLIEQFGPPALFAFVAVGHLGLIVFGLARSRQRPTLAVRTPYTYTPRTSFSMGRLFGRLRDRD